MKKLLTLLLLSNALRAGAQINFSSILEQCHVKGSITIYDLRHHKWYFSDSIDAQRQTQPASTFKIPNMLIALQTNTIENEYVVVKWPGKTDTTLYGYRPDIYHDISVKEAFEVSAGWAFIELAKRIPRTTYKTYLAQSGYGNNNLSERGDDFWNFGAFGISPKNQVDFLIKLYNGDLPFSARNMNIVRKVMISDTTGGQVIRSKTGWTRIDGRDIGWWVGYQTIGNDVYFFATRLEKQRSEILPSFSECRKKVTLTALQQLHHFYNRGTDVKP